MLKVTYRPEKVEASRERVEIPGESKTFLDPKSYIEIASET